MKRVLLLIVVLFGLSSCCTGGIVRDGVTYTAEIFASLLREKAAAKELRAAAVAAKDAGDNTTCARYARPVVLIEAKAQAQAYRALWLAGLPYPEADGTVHKGLNQEDPGVAPTPKPVASVCD